MGQETVKIAKKAIKMGEIAVEMAENIAKTGCGAGELGNIEWKWDKVRLRWA